MQGEAEAVDNTHLAGSAAHLPVFITPPGHTDILMVVVGILLVLSVAGVGALFLTLHSLPERIAHRSKKLQMEIVAVLCLLALFTHQHIFWVIALILAMIDLPDISTPVQRMATALERLAGLPPSDPELTGVAASADHSLTYGEHAYGKGEVAGDVPHRDTPQAEAPPEGTGANPPAQRS